MEYGDSIPYSQENTTGPYPEPKNPIDIIPSYAFKIYFDIVTDLVKALRFGTRKLRC
jgi:hypothetical protein